jgi:hypothetical protein
MGNKTPSKWSFIFVAGFIGVMMVAAFVPKQPCTICPIVQMLKGIRTCQVPEPNSSPSEPEPNFKPAQSNQ